MPTPDGPKLPISGDPVRCPWNRCWARDDTCRRWVSQKPAVGSNPPRRQHQTDWRIFRLDKSGCPASRPATEMSSSSASQCKPPLLSSTSARCSALASSRRGNQASGAAIVLPSARLTHMVSSSNRTALGEVFIPGPFNQVFVRRNHDSQVAKGASVEPVAVGKIDRRRQPEFCLAFSIANMNMHCLTRIAFVGIEENRNGL